MEYNCNSCDKKYLYKKHKNTKEFCNSCMANLRRFNKKTKLIEYKGGCCQVCGYNKCFESLTFHHLDPSKKDFTISGNHTIKWERLKSEVNKCALLCSNCHMEVHAGLIKLSVILNDINIVDYNINPAKEFARNSGNRFNKLEGNTIQINKEELQEFLNSGKKVKEIANLFKVSDETIYRRLQEFNLEYPECESKLKFFTTREELQDLVWKMSVLKISKQFNVSRTTIVRKIKKWKILVPKVGFWGKVGAGLVPYPNGVVQLEHSTTIEYKI